MLKGIARLIAPSRILSGLRRKREPVHPLGYWRCTRATHPFLGKFVEGRIYLARYEPAGTTSIRVIPADHDHWSPYWSRYEGRFCYEPDRLDFEYVGEQLPQGESCLSTSRDDGERL